MWLECDVNAWSNLQMAKSQCKIRSFSLFFLDHLGFLGHWVKSYLKSNLKFGILLNFFPSLDFHPLMRKTSNKHFFCLWIHTMSSAPAKSIIFCLCAEVRSWCHWSNRLGDPKNPGIEESDYVRLCHSYLASPQCLPRFHRFLLFFLLLCWCFLTSLSLNKGTKS